MMTMTLRWGTCRTWLNQGPSASMPMQLWFASHPLDDDNHCDDDYDHNNDDDDDDAEQVRQERESKELLAGVLATQPQVGSLFILSS